MSGSRYVVSGVGLGMLSLYVVSGVGFGTVCHRRVPSGPTFPTFSTFFQHFKKIPTFFRQPFLEDGYNSILTKKCVV